MTQKNQNIVIAIFLLVFLSFANIRFFDLKPTLAAGINNISVNLTDTTPSGSGSVAISFEVDEAIPQNGSIEIEFPNDFNNMEIASSTGTNLGLGPTFGTGETATTLTIALGTGGTVTGSAVTASGFTITNPAEEGFYLVQIRTYDDNDVILAMGFKLLEIGTPIDIKSKVEESLVVSLDSGTKIFAPDPAIGSGRILDQVSTLTVQTNANTSYLITGELENNKLTSTGSQILSQSGEDDYFRIRSVELSLESGSGTTAADNTVFTGATSLFTKSSGISTNGDLISINYDLNISYYKDPGNYTGGIVYSVYPTF